VVPVPKAPLPHHGNRLLKKKRDPPTCTLSVLHYLSTMWAWDLQAWV
jgi:hypothetical protein